MCLYAYGFRFFFTPLPGFFSPFLHSTLRYRSLGSIQAWRVVPPASHRISRVRRYSGSCSLSRLFAYMTVTFFGVPSHALQLKLKMLNAVHNPAGIAVHGLASFAFARHYSQNLVWFLFLPLLRCFSSGGSPHTAIDSLYDAWLLIMRIAPFGNLRINACLQLHAAYRSWPRPSSAPNAKAFSIRSY